MERSKGLILIVVGLAAALIIWQVGFNKSEEPSSSNSSQKQNTNTDGEQVNAAQGNSERIPASSNRIQGGTDTTENPRPTNQPDYRNMGRGNNTGRGRGTSNIQTAGYKIAIPEKLETAKLRELYDEYLKIRDAGFGSNRNFGNRNTGRGQRGGNMQDMGMMGGRGGMGGFGGGMGGFGGMNGGDMTDMMNQMMDGMGGDAADMMNQMMNGMGGGFGGGMMGGMMGGGQMDMGMAPDAQMDMNFEEETNLDETYLEDTQNNF